MPTKKVEPLGTYNTTNRGFGRVEFTDRNGIECSIQCSSAIDFEAEGSLENPGSGMLWLGVRDAGKTAQVMAVDAAKVGIQTNERYGWIPFPIPDEVLLQDRMHLTRSQVRGLVKRLNHWLKHGDLALEGEVE